MILLACAILFVVLLAIEWLMGIDRFVGVGLGRLR